VCTLDLPRRTFFFAGKVAPAYHFANLAIKFINNLAGTLDGDPITQDRLKVVFVPATASPLRNISSRRATCPSKSRRPATKPAGRAT
jgi:hypothetical protein